jgi:hypothetical protein
MFAPIRPTPTKPILEDFIRTKLSYSAKKREEGLSQAAKKSVAKGASKPIPREFPPLKIGVSLGRDWD